MLTEIFINLKERGLCRTEPEFSVEWLGMSHSYLNMARKVTEGGSIAVCLRLAATLNDRGIYDLAAKLQQHVAKKTREPRPASYHARRRAEERVSA